MAGPDPRPITSESLRRRAEWQAVFPGAELVWDETADEGRGVGFDGLDPSAMARAFYATRSSWDEVLDWYRSLLERRGWQGREVKPSTWWAWTSAARPGETIDVLDRGRWEELPGWDIPAERIGQLGFEVIFRARGPYSATMGADDA